MSNGEKRRIKKEIEWIRDDSCESGVKSYKRTIGMSTNDTSVISSMDPKWVSWMSHLMMD